MTDSVMWIALGSEGGARATDGGQGTSLDMMGGEKLRTLGWVVARHVICEEATNEESFHIGREDSACVMGHGRGVSGCWQEWNWN